VPPPPYRVSHIVFDVDGTLVDFESALRAALEVTAGAASSHLGTLVDPSQLQRARELVAVDPAWRGRTLTEVRNESIRRVLASAGETSEEAVRIIAETYYAARDQHLHPYDDVEPAITALAERGFTIILATNGNAVLDRHPFMRHVAHLQQAEQVGVLKPDPRFFRMALHQTGGAPSRAISVGDRFENDIAPPLAIGMHAVFVDRDDRAPDIEVHRIRSLAELPDLLELA
jgi:putative hydrolase of the HAD superfamily